MDLPYNMESEEFRKHAHQAVDWVADYLQGIENLPVKSKVKPGDIIRQIPSGPPEKPEPFEDWMTDLEKVIMPGITHWQHPHFHAYFPGNSSYPSVIAEIITAGLGAQCMVWETSPAAAELEEQMMNWLKHLLALPVSWDGVIQDTASTATLAALLTAREVCSGEKTNSEGFTHNNYRIYCSTETHSSIDKAVRIAGFGSDNLVKIAVDDDMAMLPEKLEKAIEKDLAEGKVPCAVVGASGTTGTLAFDPLKELGEICSRHGIWFHVDAAYAGTAMIVPEKRALFQGVELADSFVFNPHKWMFTNFDCTAYFVKDKEQLIKTFEILPEYLKNSTRGTVNDYRDWGIPLGRRFRALKLWFVMRSYGQKGLIETIGKHCGFGDWVAKQINNHAHFELLCPSQLNVVVFRWANAPEEDLNELNTQLLSAINDSGKAYLSHTKVEGKFAIRLVLGQTRLEENHVHAIWDLIQTFANDLKA